MILQYNELAADLARVRRFLQSSSTGRQTPDQRRFAYIACISALYSSFENFAEKVAHSFGKILLDQPETLNPDQLASLRRRYVRNSATLLGQSLGVGRYRDVSEHDVAMSLASCLDETANFDLRIEVLTFHSSNLRLEPLFELFRWAVPELSTKIGACDAVEAWASLNPEVSRSALLSAIDSELDDLVERRNEVAHRAIPDDILSYDNLLDKATFIETLALGLMASLKTEIVDRALKNDQCVPLGNAQEVFKDGRVVVISALQEAVSEGDFVLMRNQRVARWGQVLEVQVSDERVTRAPAGVEAGLLLSFAARKGAQLHCWRTPHSELLAPPPGIFGLRGPFAA